LTKNCFSRAIDVGGVLSGRPQPGLLSPLGIHVRGEHLHGAIHARRLQLFDQQHRQEYASSPSNRRAPTLAAVRHGSGSQVANHVLLKELPGRRIAEETGYIEEQIQPARISAVAAIVHARVIRSCRKLMRLMRRSSVAGL
jgi:hypothetical protein